MLDVVGSPSSHVGGLGWVLRDHLDRVRLAGYAFVPKCNAVKNLEARAIYDGLCSLTPLNIHYDVIEANYLEVGILLNATSVDLTEVSFFIMRLCLSCMRWDMFSSLT